MRSIPSPIPNLGTKWRSGIASCTCRFKNGGANGGTVARFPQPFWVLHVLYTCTLETDILVKRHQAHLTPMTIIYVLFYNMFKNTKKFQHLGRKRNRPRLQILENIHLQTDRAFIRQAVTLA
jgi:hypothetical protein